jgi:hypothetical protein
MEGIIFPLSKHAKRLLKVVLVEKPTLPGYPMDVFLKYPGASSLKNTIWD